MQSVSVQAKDDALGEVLTIWKTIRKECPETVQRNQVFLVCFGFYNKIPQIWRLINNRYLFLIVLELEI